MIRTTCLLLFLMIMFSLKSQPTLNQEIFEKDTVAVKKEISHDIKDLNEKILQLEGELEMKEERGLSIREESLLEGYLIRLKAIRNEMNDHLDNISHANTKNWKTLKANTKQYMKEWQKQIDDLVYFIKRDLEIDLDKS